MKKSESQKNKVKKDSAQKSEQPEKPEQSGQAEKSEREELQAINEELRSATEELETGKEELQSVNEELQTVNQELKIKIEELSNSNDDLQNLMNSTNIGTIFLDRALRVKMFTPVACEIFNLIPADLGRVLSDITHKLEYQDLIADVETVLNKLQPVEIEVRTSNGKIFLMQITPYRTADDRIGGAIVAFVNITTSKRAELDLRHSQAETERQRRLYEAILSNTPDLVYVFDLDHRFTYANDGLLRMWGKSWDEAIGKNCLELGYEPWHAEMHDREIEQVIATKEPIRGEVPFDGAFGRRIYDYIFVPVIGADGAVEAVAGTTRDITKHNLREANLAFLNEIAVELSRLSTAREIMETVGAKIGAFLNLSNCAFAEIDEAADNFVVNHDWHREDAPGLVGVYGIEEFVTDEFQRAARAGETIVVRDTFADPRIADAEKLAALHINSFITVPLIRDGEWRFVLAVYDSKARDWRADEIELIRELTTRIFPRLEHARAEEGLQASEEKYRTLFDSIDEGFCVIEMMFDAGGKPSDYRFLESNPMFEQLTGLENAMGKRALELVPNLEDFWIETYGKVALTGEAVRFENHAEPMNRWFDVHASRVGDDTSRKVAIVFTNITERKRMEEDLRESEEHLRLIIKSVEDYAIITTDVKGVINGWNTGAEKIFGYTEQEIVGKSAEVIFTAEDREKNILECEMQTALRTGCADDKRQLTRRDDTRFFADGVMYLLEDGKVEGFVKIVRDMSERLAAEQTTRDKEMLQKLVHAQEDERKRIARDLHDELGQLLTGLRLKLESVRKLCEDDGELCGKIDETQTLARRVDDGIDFLAWELRPAALDDLGLRPALEKYVSEWSHYSGVTAELLGDSSVKKMRLAPEAETNLYRIAQEALNNVNKHAEAKSVEVSLEKRGKDLIVLIISDDGKGFEPEKKMNRSKGIGLIGMRERATLIGGSLEIESAPGNGTTVFVRVPIGTETTK